MGLFVKTGECNKVEEKKMKIVIIGDGKVGYKLAKTLSEGEYDVTLIDHNEEKLEEALNRLDIFCVHGDGASVEIQKSAGVAEADLVIACTSTDECNMLSCLIARRVGARHTIARVRNPIYFKQINILKEDLRLSMAVNPELTVAGEISRLLLMPNASKVELFAKGRVELVEFPVAADSLAKGMTLAEVYQHLKIKVLVCAVERGEEVLIPNGDFVIQIGDRLHIAASHKDVGCFFEKMGHRKMKIKRVLICGGGRVSYYLGHRLCNMGMQVKIIEKKFERCEELCELLPKATIIHGDATDQDLLIEEGIDETDAMIALTGMDEENILMGLFAQSREVCKVIAKINEDQRARMVEKLGLDCTVSAKTATADAILSYVRARKNSQSSANVETIYQLIDGKVEALEFVIKKEAKYTNIPFKALSTKPNNLIACIVRNREIIIPNGDDSMQVGDNVIVVTTEKQMQDIGEILL